ncbi:MAG: tripartite tricarboxylate transporter substrate-binding protein, partial [Geminicoccaceae bacterium]|nr:tripartite tricarboxylate transporter substrate-binding protein [Geminicoccaceae bacterium]
AGLPQVNSDNWYGLAAPAATPPEIGVVLHRAAVAALSDPALVEAFARADAIPAPMSPEETLAFLRAEQAKWGPIVRAVGA